MLRTPWSRLAAGGFNSLIQRLTQKIARRCGIPSGRRLRRSRGNWSSLTIAAEILENRQLLSAPMAMSDSYSVTHDHTLTVSTGSSVLNNDMNMGMGTMTAILYSNPSHGSLSAFNSDGSFTYVPSAHYAGTDTFQYQAHNSDGSSSPATVTITVINHAPTTAAANYTIYQDSMTFSAASGVLSGDSDADSDTLSASLVTGPSHGSLTLNSNGSFTYTPTTGYYGADSFVYAASDGVTSTNGTVNLTDTNPFSAQTNSPDTPMGDYNSYQGFAALQLTGGTQVSYALPGSANSGTSLVYSSLAADVKPIVTVETTFQGSTSIPIPNSFKVDLTLGGVSASTLYFNNTGLTSTGSPTVRISDQINASSLATGRYQYTMTVTAYYGSSTATRVFTGYQNIVNWQSSSFGKGWNLASLDGLAVQSGGVLWYSGTGDAAWFASNGSGGFTAPAGPMAFDTLVQNSGGTYTLTDKFGNQENFSSAGALTSTVDANGNTTSYAYSSGKLSTITDPFGRTTTFNYTTGLMTSINDVASKTTTFTYTGTNLTTVTAPVPATGVASPVTTYAYTGNLLTSITDPKGNATTLAYSFGDRISQATLPDTTTESFSPAEMLGLVNTSTGTGTSSSTPATPYLPGSLDNMTTMTDPLSHSSSIKVDGLGDVLSSTDPLNLLTTYTYNSNGQLTQVTQPSVSSGTPVTSYTYNSSGDLTQVTHPDSTTDTYTYGTSGGSLNRPLTHTDQRGNTTTYTYDSHGNVLTITDPAGNVTTMTYTSAGLLASVTAPNPSTGGATGGLVTSYTYDSDGRVTRITNPDSTHKDFTYDSEDNLVTSSDELGRTTTYAYDNLSRLTSVTQPVPATGVSAPVTSFGYDADGNVTSITDPLGNVTSYAFNSRGWLTTTTLPAATTGGTSPTIIIGYNSDGWKTSETDPLGNMATYGYNADGWRTSFTLPAPTSSSSTPVATYTYDNLGRLTSKTDANSHTTNYAYNSANRLTSVTDPLGNVTAYTYDNLGNVLTVTAPNPSTGTASGPVTTYTYDALSNVATVTDPLGNVTTYAYDHDNRTTSVTDPVPTTGVSAPVTSYTYDSISRLSTETDPLGNVTTYGYDSANELTTVTAPNPSTGGATGGLVTTYGYNGDGLKTTTTNPDSQTTTTAYNANGRVTSVTDASGNTTSYTYDYDNHLITDTDPSGHTNSYSYNLDGELTSKTDKNSRVTNYTYDHLGRLTQEQWMSGSTAIYTAAYVYDPVGKITSASDNNSTYAYTYNSDNLVTQIDNSGTPTGPHAVLNLGYDRLNRETSESATVGGTADFLNNYAYNADSSITQITQQGQTAGITVAPKLVNYAYDNDGRLTTISRYANLTATQLVTTSSYGFDANSNVTSLTQTQSSTTLNSYTYSYDHAGRVISDSSNDGTATYSYDAASQLTAASYSYQTNAAYSYDSTGNRTNTGYSTVANNEIASDGTYNYTYDNAGNLTKKTTISTGAYTTYTWDYHNRLTDVSMYNSSNVLQAHTHYAYDVLDRLIEQQIDPTGSGTYTTSQSYVYDASPTAKNGGAPAIALVYNGSGALTHRILNGPGLNNQVADENGSGTVAWLLGDNHGTIRDVVAYNPGTNTTTIIDHLKYDSFGQITSQTNSANQPIFGFTGQIYDSTVGLYYYHARWYNPADGRFISQDPTGFLSHDVNFYRYVFNSPTNFTDPSGRIIPLAVGGVVLLVLIFAPTNPANAPEIGDTPLPSNPYGNIPTALRAVGYTLIAGRIFRAIYGGGEAAYEWICDANCFVAGTPVLIMATNGELDGDELNSSVSDIRARTFYLLIAGGFGISLVLGNGRQRILQLVRRRRHIRGRKRSNVDYDWQVPDEDSCENDCVQELQYCGCSVGNVLEHCRAHPEFVLTQTAPSQRIHGVGCSLNQLSEWGTNYGSDSDAAQLHSLGKSTNSAFEGGDGGGFQNFEKLSSEDDFRCITFRPKRNSRERKSAKLVNRLRGLGIAAIIVAFICVLGGQLGWPENRATTAEKTTDNEFQDSQFTAIEKIRVGQRVVTHSVILSDSRTDTIVDPRSWRHLRLNAVDIRPDGFQDTIEIETIQPPEWVADNNASIGATVPIPIDLVDMGVSAQLTGTVIKNQPCPPIHDGLGRVVLTTINHFNRNVIELELVDRQGRTERLRPTVTHKFFSDSRNKWLSAQELRRGERLRGAFGTVVVAGLTQIPGIHRVYNMTVERDHVYRVSSFAVLVHNEDCGGVDETVNLYRQGWFPDGTFAGSRPIGEDWSFDHPAGTPGFSGGHGIPMPGGAGQPDWMAGGHLTPDAPGVSAGPSTPVGPNPGGWIEGSVGQGGVELDWFHMPDVE